MQYLTPQHYKTAEQNGITPRALEQRVRVLGWSINEATTKPLKGHLWRKWGHLCKENGIPRYIFSKRIHDYEWEAEKAATEPVRKDRSERNRKYPKEYQDLAEQNGIHYQTYKYRLAKGWSYKDAATLPPKVGRWANGSRSNQGRPAKAIDLSPQEDMPV
jgi:hypothetical protein